MLWLRFSSLLTYITIFVINIIQLVLTYDLFIVAEKYHFLFENDNVISIYHRNNSNIYWFLFSTFISFIIFGLSFVYHTYYYSKAFYTYVQKNPREFYYFLLNDELYTFSIYEFLGISVNTAWSIIWCIHISLDILLRSVNIDETGKLFLLLATQITLISLRYPLLFKQIGNDISVIDSQMLNNDDVISKINFEIDPRVVTSNELRNLIK